ncbi:hypothetical protein [Streptomyces acidicola]|uniref:hypothetical protein n=1 Tax=Streptomyces acidicola TaxID=2596892 RepID=UPI003420B751
MTEPPGVVGESVDIQLYSAGIKIGPLKHFTKCFRASSSTATWTGLPKSIYYFKIEKIHGKSSTIYAMDVDQVSVDTTQAD